MYKDTTESAKDVRKVLKSEYPNTKFSVRVKRFSMGSSVDIAWTDGPTEKEVADKTAHLKGGEYLNEYIGTQRTISRQVMVAAAEAYTRHYGLAEARVLWDHVHRAVWATSVYDTTPEEAFRQVFP